MNNQNVIIINEIITDANIIIRNSKKIFSWLF